MIIKVKKIIFAEIYVMHTPVDILYNTLLYNESLIYNDDGCLYIKIDGNSAEYDVSSDKTVSFLGCYDIIWKKI